MTAITFLGSSKPFIIPEEIERYNNRTVFDQTDDWFQLGVSEVEDTGWEDETKRLFTLPYLYEIRGVYDSLFLLYLEKYMEVGDILELLYIPNQHDFATYERKIMEDPDPILINIGSLTYQNRYGTYQLHPEKWVEELRRKNFVTEFGITTIVKYEDKKASE